jgi:hypothetical protein
MMMFTILDACSSAIRHLPSLTWLENLFACRPLRQHTPGHAMKAVAAYARFGIYQQPQIRLLAIAELPAGA